MKRTFVKVGAVVGVLAASTLAAGPALAAATVSQATAQALQLSIGGTPAVTQLVTATNDGTTETKNNASTLPNLAAVLPANSLLGPGVAPQDAGANANGTSFACAGIAGTGSGIVTVGTSSCNINGKPLTISLANLNLGNVILGSNSVLGNALNNIPGLGTLLSTLGSSLTTLVNQISSALATTPLGQVSVGGALSAIEGECTANPSAATGTTHLVDTQGGSSNIPIGVTIPNGSGGTQTLTLLDLPANPPVNTHVLVNLNTVTQTLITALKVELNTAVGGALANLGLGTLLQQVQDTVVNQLVANLQPLLQALQSNILDVGLNLQTSSDAGKKIAVTALDLQVLPAAKQFTGSSLISGDIGKVTCGPNAAKPSGPTTPSGTPTTPGGGKVPTGIESGLAGGNNTGTIIAAMSVLLAAGGAAGTAAYRRYWMPRG